MSELLSTGMSTLVLLRHGESVWNRENLFTGWTDVDLSDRGVEEAHEAARLLLAEGLLPDVVHTSFQKRATRTASVVMSDMDLDWLPIRRSWRLNERHYGDLEGRDKKQIGEQYGPAQLKAWRRSYDVPPPPLDPADPRHPRHDRRYAALAPDLLPGSESLKDVVARMLPWWYDAIVPDLRAGRVVLVAAHGNSLRALVMHLEELSGQEVAELNIPTGIPLVYELDDAMRPSGASRYLDPEEAARRAQAVALQAGAAAAAAPAPTATG